MLKVANISRVFLLGTILVFSLLPVKAENPLPTEPLRSKEYDVAVERDIPTKMRDGTVLRSDVYRPVDRGKFPVLLKRTPYSKLDGDGVFTPEFAWKAAAKGYVVIIQDCRGRFRSEGEWYPLKYESQDGYDTVEWAATLPYGNGRIGIFGDSYFAVTATLAALAHPPHLAGVFVVFPAADYNDGFGYQGGVFLQELMEGWTSGVALNTLERRMQKNIPLTRWETEFPLGEYPALAPPQDLGPGLAPYFFDWISHPSYDDYWKQWSTDLHADAVNIPIYQVAGWYDLFQGGTLKHYLAYRTRGGEVARRKQWLMIGPWNHGPLTGKPGDLDFGPASRGNMETLSVRWFDYILKNIDDGIGGEKPVKVFVMGANVWRDENEWPLAGARASRFYLHSQGKAASLSGDGMLSTVPPEGELADHFVYDPADPVPTAGSASGARDQRAVEARPDVMVYTTPPFREALEVTGPISAEIYASSSAVDTDFTAKLVDVWPNGYAQNLTDGIIRARYRDSFEKPEFMNPGQIYRFSIDLWATSNLFLPGHRLRLEISSSNFPRFNRNLNTGDDMFHTTRMLKAMNSIYHDSDHASALILPVVAQVKVSLDDPVHNSRNPYIEVALKSPIDKFIHSPNRK